MLLDALDAPISAQVKSAALPQTTQPGLVRQALSAQPLVPPVAAYDADDQPSDRGFEVYLAEVY